MFNVELIYVKPTCLNRLWQDGLDKISPLKPLVSHGFAIKGLKGLQILVLLSFGLSGLSEARWRNLIRNDPDG